MKVYAASLRRVQLPAGIVFDGPNRPGDDYPPFTVKATRAFRLPYLYRLVHRACSGGVLGAH